MAKTHHTDEIPKYDDDYDSLPGLWAGEEAPRVETPWMNLALYLKNIKC